MAGSPNPWTENAHDQAASCPQHTWGSLGPVLNERPELGCILEAGTAKAMKNWRGWGGWRRQCQWSETTEPFTPYLLPNPKQGAA